MLCSHVAQWELRPLPVSSRTWSTELASERESGDPMEVTQLRDPPSQVSPPSLWAFRERWTTKAVVYSRLLPHHVRWRPLQPSDLPRERGGEEVERGFWSPASPEPRQETVGQSWAFVWLLTPEKKSGRFRVLWGGDGTGSRGSEGLAGGGAERRRGRGHQGAHEGFGAVSSTAAKLAWVPGPASVFTAGSQRHSSLGGDSTHVLTPSCPSGHQGGKGRGTGQLSAVVTAAVTPGEHDPPGLLTHL